MKILFVVPYVPSLVRVRPYNLIRHLSALGHEVSVLTISANEQAQEEIEQLRQHCRDVQAIYLPRWRSVANCLRALPTSTPLQAVYSWHPALAQRLVEMNRHADVIHVEHLRGANYGLAVKSKPANGRGTAPVVWDSVDCITNLFRQAAQQSSSRIGRWLSHFELVRTAQYEGWLVNQFSRVLVTSPAERAALLSLLPTQKRAPQIKVLPNGVDLAYFKPDTATAREAATLVISGKMSYHANVAMVTYFVRNILPYLWDRRPETRLRVVGKDPPRTIQALARDRRISVIGTVADIRPYLQSATIAVAPLTYGAGIQNKVLEAMACATPVVASSQAVSALAVTPGKDLLVANEPAEFAEAVLDLLGDQERQRQVGEAGRRFVERNHRWDHIAAQLHGVYAEVVGTRY